MRKNLSDATLRGHVALDSSVLVEILDGSEIGSKLTKALLNEEIIAHASFVNMTEAEYILCRKIGHDDARNAVEGLLDSGYVAIEEDPTIHTLASAMKCGRSISLADCYTFAVAQITAAKAVFAFKESELLREMGRKPFTSQIVFLEEQASPANA
ncbi:MAG: PIN domain-containing protein [Thaumarchaeota archaeon]|nr:PIN domain-containing protein [Nitrososphaerota archaeon]